MHSPDNEMPGYCAKDNSETDMKKGCLHPKDFCQHRTSCMIHFFEKERERETKKTAMEDSGDNC